MAKRHRHDPPLSPTPADDNPTATTIDTESDSSTNATTPKHYRPSQHPPQPAIIHCNFLPTCSHRPFTSYAAFESHYHQHHTHRCHECNRNFPSERYLTIHIAENHDAFNELKRERGERTFGCFVEGCEKVCLTPQKRRLHSIDKHGFPKDFYFRVVDYGIDHCNSLIHTTNRHSKTPKNQGHKNGSTTTTTTTTATDTSAPSSPESAGKDTTNSEPGTKDLEMKDVGIDVDGLAVSASAAPIKANNDTLPHKRIPPIPKKGRSPKSGEGGTGVKSKEEAEVVADKQKQEQKQPEDAVAVAVDTEDKELADVTNLMASVKLIPRQIRFGRRGGGKVGFVGNTRR